MEKWLKDEKTTRSAASKYHINPIDNKYPFFCWNAVCKFSEKQDIATAKVNYNTFSANSFFVK